MTPRLGWLAGALVAAGASQTVIMLLYDTAFKYFRLGDASVMAVFVFGALLVVTLLQWRLFRRQVEF